MGKRAEFESKRDIDALEVGCTVFGDTRQKRAFRNAASGAIACCTTLVHMT
jgi:hypothetical protein